MRKNAENARNVVSVDLIEGEENNYEKVKSSSRTQPVEMVIDLCCSDEEEMDKKARPTRNKVKKEVELPAKNPIAKRISYKDGEISEEEEILIKPPTKRAKTSMLRLLISITNESAF
jgi:hypothetical protein